MATMAEHKGRRTRRRFSEDYKTGAVRLVFDEGRTVGRRCAIWGWRSRRAANGVSRQGRIARKARRG